MQDKNEILNLIEKSDNILITTHISPDFDAIGSMLALFWILKSMHAKKISMIIKDPLPFNAKYIEGMDQIIQDDISKVEVLDKFDLIFILDANRKSRLTRSDFEFLPHQQVVIIDHHMTGADVEATVHIKENTSSTGEILYKLFVDEITFSQQIAKSLLTAIYDDTNGFSTKNVGKQTIEIVAHLIELGANISETANFLKTYDEAVLNALKTLINNLSFDDAHKYAYSYITPDVYTLLGLNNSKFDLISNLFMDILLGREGYSWGFIARPDDDNNTKVSFRSRNEEINVRSIAEILGGGGHDAAAGATLNTSDVYDTLATTRNAIAKYKKNG